MALVQKSENGLIVDCPLDDVVAHLKMANWGWKTEWGWAPDGVAMIEVKGSFMKDNAAAAVFEVRPLSDGRTALAVQGSRGNLMEAIGGNVFNVGVKKFTKKVIEKAEELLTSL